MKLKPLARYLPHCELVSTGLAQFNETSRTFKGMTVIIYKYHQRIGLLKSVEDINCDINNADVALQKPWPGLMSVTRQLKSLSVHFLGNWTAFPKQIEPIKLQMPIKGKPKSKIILN